MIARALVAACVDGEVLARIGGALGEAARASLAGDRGADRGERARWAAAARTPVPAGLRGVHPSWLEAGLAGLPPRARAAVAAGGGAPVDTWLARWATAGIPPMRPAEAGRIDSPDAATRADAASLTRWLEDAGADQLAFALEAAGSGAVARAAGAAAARVVGARLLAAAARIGVAPRLGALGPVRAAIARCRLELDARALLRIGARAVAPHLEPLARRRIAHRLPYAVGRWLGEELEAAARVPLVDVPRWPALVS
ncbi:MAG TPA: hypothetical protein VGC42_25385 [Kofleriaceae bacterium]